MNLSRLSDLELHEQTQRCAEKEKSATLLLLEHLAEVDSRMLYAKRGYSSLWEYVHRELGYSESQASERVSAMRLMTKVPEVKIAIEKGSMTLTSTLKLASFIKKEKPSTELTLQLLKECENQSTRQVERTLLSYAEQPEKLPFSPLAEKITPILIQENESLSRVQFTADQELLDLIERSKQLSANPGLEIRELIRIALKEYLQKRKVKIGSKLVASLRAPEVNSSSNSDQATQSRYIRQSIRTQVRLRSKDQCEFVDLLTQRRCNQRAGLEFDHIHPFAKGGEATISNLRHYCRTHNRLHAVQSYGRAKIEKYAKR